MGFLFGGKSKTPKIPKQEPLPEPEKYVPVQQVTAKEEEESIRKALAKKRRATMLALGVENQPKIFKQQLGAGM